jgi:4-cresol dehydrogenase (hydroxylating)
MDTLISFLKNQNIAFSVSNKEDFETTYETNNFCKIIVFPKTHQQVETIIHQLNEAQLTYHVISTGLNWGYGGKVPKQSKHVLVNLVHMKKIIVDADAKTVTLEPGVTQIQLFDFIKQNNYDLMNPITGASIHSSIVGNALTGGYSNGVNNIRFDRILAIKGVWNNGTAFDTFTTENTKYFDGESIQGQLKGGQTGIVTQMKLTLDELPNCFTVLLFSTQTESNFVKLNARLIELKHQNIINTNWCFFNGYRILAETLPCYPKERDREKVLSKKEMLQMLQKLNPLRWNKEYNGFVALYTPSDDVANALANHIHLNIFPYCDKIDTIQLNHKQIREMRNSGSTDKLNHEDCLTKGRMATFLGIPTKGSVPMSYWRKTFQGSGDMDIEADQCGFVWLAVSITSKAEKIAECIKIYEKHCFNFQIEPFYVVDGIKKHEIYIMFAMVFDKQNTNEALRVRAIYDHASKDLEAIGANIYRKPADY